MGFARQLLRAWYAIRMTPPAQSNTACCFREVKEGSSAGNWYMCPDSVGRRDRPMTICDPYVDRGLAASMGASDQASPTPFRAPWNPSVSLGR